MVDNADIEQEWLRLREAIVQAHATPADTLPHGTLVEQDKSFAIFLASEAGEEESYPTAYWERIGKDPSQPLELYWHAHLALINARYGNLGSGVDDETRTRISSAVDTGIDDFFSDWLEQIGLFPMIDVLESCLLIVMCNRLADAPSKPFPTLLDRTLCAGGLPCGLEPDREDGRLLVYWPHAKPPTIDEAQPG
ncbi:MAG: hypothetical protein AAGA57_12600 [Planctomycetota bacterium]